MLIRHIGLPRSDGIPYTCRTEKGVLVSRWTRLLLFYTALFLLAPSYVFAETFSGKCVGVTDGDTVKVLRDGREVKIRLEGIDCPESGDAFSAKAKKFTSSLVFGKVVTVRVKELDQYGRTVGTVFVDGQNISLALVQAGLAWHYKKYSSDPALAQAENTAKAAEIGVWSLPNPAPPWEVRAQKAQAVSSQSAPVTSKKSGTIYHGNRNSHVFHAPWCRYYGCKNCTAIFNSREDAIKAGYRPGGHCKP